MKPFHDGDKGLKVTLSKLCKNDTLKYVSSFHSVSDMFIVVRYIRMANNFYIILWWVANGITSIASKSMMVVRGNEASSGRY